MMDTYLITPTFRTLGEIFSDGAMNGIGVLNDKLADVLTKLDIPYHPHFSDSVMTHVKMTDADAILFKMADTGFSIRPVDQ